jgi:hypothetical protein
MQNSKQAYDTTETSELPGMNASDPLMHIYGRYGASVEENSCKLANAAPVLVQLKLKQAHKDRDDAMTNT